MGNKSSDGLENSSPRSASERLLFLLKAHGPQTCAALAASLQITAEAVRQQVIRLAAEGLVDSGSERAGVGRPCQVWKLTPAGEATFPDRHAFVATQLIRNIRNQFGEVALEQVLHAHAGDIEHVYSEELRSAKTLEEKVRRLAEARAREGYMAGWHKQSDNTFLLFENHCPITAAATACQGFCSAELNTFRHLFGHTVQVERSEHMLQGARRCAYTIRPKRHAPAKKAK